MTAPEESRLEEIMARKVTRYEHFENDPEFQELMDRRIQRISAERAERDERKSAVKARPVEIVEVDTSWLRRRV